MSILLPLARDLSRKAEVFVAPSVAATIHPQCFARTIRQMKKCAVLCGRQRKTNQALVMTQVPSLISVSLNSDLNACEDVVHASTPSSGQLLDVFFQNNAIFSTNSTSLPFCISEAKSTHRQTPNYMIQRFAGDSFLPIACVWENTILVINFFYVVEIQ